MNARNAANLVLILSLATLANAGEIHTAVRNGDLATVKRLVEADRSVLASVDDDGYTPIEAAVQFGPPELVRYLLDNGARLGVENGCRYEPLFLASDPRIVAMIVADDPQLLTKDYGSQTPLQMAAHHVAYDWPNPDNSRKLVRFYLQAGMTYDIRSAIYLNDMDRMRAILDADPRQANDDPPSEETPLRIAARLGRVEAGKLLLEHGADPDDVREGGHFSIIVSALEHPEFVKLLLDAGANVHIRMNNGNDWVNGVPWITEGNATALHYAAEKGQIASAKVLLDYGAKIDARDSTSALSVLD